MRFLTNTDNNRNQAGCRSRIGKESRHGSCNDHDTDHQFDFSGTEEFNDLGTDVLGQTGVEHGCTDDKHTAEKNNRGVGESQKYLFNRYESQYPASNSCKYGRYCER